MRRFLIYFCSILAFSTSLIWGQDTPPPAKTAEKAIPPEKALPPGFLDELEKDNQIQETHFLKEFFKMILVLGAMIALLMFLTWFTKRLVAGRFTQLNRASAVKVLERRALSNRSVLFLVEIGGKFFALAESHNGITYLTQVPPITEEEAKPFSKYMNQKE